MSAGLTILQAIASSCTIVMILSSMPSVYHIYKNHNTGCVALLPLVGLWLSCHLVTLYGWATGSYFPLFAIYFFGELTSIVYVSVFYRWTTARSYSTKAIAVNIFTIVLLTTYVVLGMTGTIKTVVKTRSGASIPLGMCLAGAISNALWVLEGYLDNDIFMLVLSAACSFMGFVQVMLYIIYRPGRYPAAMNISYVLPTTVTMTVKSNRTVETPCRRCTVSTNAKTPGKLHCFPSWDCGSTVTCCKSLYLAVDIRILLITMMSLVHRMLYGWATADYFPLFTTYLFGDIMSVVYLAVFFQWTKQRAYALKAIGASFLVVVITTTYTILGMTGATGQTTDQVGLVTGYMMAVGSVLLYISPFETIKTVLKTRSGASIPFGMCLAGATSNVLWMINGLLTNDIFIFLLGTVCASLGFVQVVLYLIYRPGRSQVGVEVIVEQTQPGKKFVLPTTTPQSDVTTGSLPSPVFIAVHSP
ncbi:Hypothetical protein PHPALM_17349 [Phytophthora palmivora]|uniref:MtN3-like protein n=1 Tax=Phytophthora palmivora TaxID=4796 RepID=A0A2P4XMI5_9STRA|nr:Hypothetical protein PHPALM_17349 [Phytophthora palmivora]